MTTQPQTTDLEARAAQVFGPAEAGRARSLCVRLVEADRDGAVVVAADGRRYIDCIGGRGIFNLGRRPRRVLAALREAVQVADQGNFPLISSQKADLARRLAAFVPGELDCAIFSVSRGEALDAACKLARGHTRRPGLITVDGGWYGETGFALALSERQDAADFAPLIPDVRSVPMNDLTAAEAAIGHLDAAFVLEPVQAENGCRCVEPDYLRAVARICRDRGVLLVLDETQSGMGRTGARFAYGHWGVVPDVLVIGESLAAGAFPICATLFAAPLQEFLNDHPLIHLSTFGGSDVGCLVGQAALDDYEAMRPWENATAMGERLAASLAAVAGEHPDIVRGVSGRGLLLALDLDTVERAEALCAALADTGVLAVPGRVARASVVLRPSLLIGEEEVGQIAAGCRAAAMALAPPPAQGTRRAPRRAARAASSTAVPEEKATTAKTRTPAAKRRTAAPEEGKPAAKRRRPAAAGEPGEQPPSARRAAADGSTEAAATGQRPSGRRRQKRSPGEQ